ncbi:putative regulatory protein, FmdB family [Limihaloglobus sulfuriphilus]|uniref:Putative regulatory protein, FmdB family n=1 Tax=Limihaloglobus sulfuriphilus TaxID=1851148 RepID=A0A1Q2MB66_9BACT|nr:zinc ribbon domain-containing protein [Limihaloglobus sulfuriphilus]AQQ69921.1 putative regulatory protein, FmdB family [Limihaloglobus sulfuriphilus]
MPTYDYMCEGCGYEFEKFQSMSASALRKCPECGKMKLKRLIGTGAGIIFKGSGFYETDYRSDSYKQAAKSENSGSESKSADTKTAAKKEPAPKPEKTATSTTAAKKDAG